LFTGIRKNLQGKKGGNGGSLTSPGINNQEEKDGGPE
jgi:hypothetical protein